MKTLKIAFPLLLLVLTSACATSGGLIEGKATARGEGELSRAYVQAVEQQAKKYVMQVFWVNPPTEEALQRYAEDDGR